jgi:hypothetical protein
MPPPSKTTPLIRPPFIRGVVFDGGGLIRGVVFDGSGLIGGGLLYYVRELLVFNATFNNISSYFLLIFLLI